MIKHIELYVHGAGTADEKMITVPEDATVHDIIAEAKKLGFTEDFEAALFVEDGDRELDRSARLNECGIKHKNHVHCHHCRKVTVTVNFNGQRTHTFAPGTRVNRVLHWAVDAFGLHGVDAKNKELRLGGATGTILNSNQHIGSFTHPPKCEVELDLTAIIEVQG